MLKRVLNRILELLLRPTGYMLTRRASLRAHSMDHALRQVAARGHSLHTVIDVGASNGSWSLKLMEYYPNSQYLLIEAQPVHDGALAQLAQQRRNVHPVMAAAGEEPGELHFNAADPFGGQASRTPYATNNIRVPVTTLDQEVAQRSLPGPYLIKLDTHGFEVPILKGAARTLERTEVVIMECYNFKIAPECLMFHEMCEYMRGLGFRCIDLADPMYRPGDQVFWQADLVFVRDTRTEFSVTSYQ